MEQVQSQDSGSAVEWYSSEATTPMNTAPCEALAIFIGHTYGHLGLAQRRTISLLDIGSGSGANTLHFLDEGYLCVGVDSSPKAFAHEHGPIEEYLKSCPAYDCIFDINTLCHVENPPYAAIRGALKPLGKFFSIHPADGTEVDMTGKGYTRIADIMTMRQLLVPFPLYTIHKCTNWKGDTKINSWQIEADK